MRKFILKFVFYFAVKIVTFLRRVGLWKFPKGIRLSPDSIKSIFASAVAAELARSSKNKVYDKNISNLMKNPFLRFHANYSLTHVDLNTPCTKSLAKDLSSVTKLGNKKILCLGSRNLDEIFQLHLVGANMKNITAVDLYSEFPEIIEMDFQDLKFSDDTFDVIFWAGSYAYASDPIKALQEAFRVLRKDCGIFALGDTYIGDANKESYNLNQSEYINQNPELNQALDELGGGVTLTKGISDINEILNRINSIQKGKIILTREYIESPHYNIIMSLQS